ncbi:hypothetical protein Poli38472_002510 [Pythium oligandrum]|uniref:EF-hand domain-containing protein n=1 Tax=Pythium oligandrum TaxID=41045 RepID=A0A8K1FJW7_PYTOL|nr:hypothetical protein Poli38472_002510 [Pythium oligandrum]|eukprot:TMW63569.1 hypothetical protein Poli38472_002510 [Pythium oligandrum]
MCAPISTKFALEPLLEIAGAATFRVEMLEYQIRTALVESAFSKTRGRFDSQRTVNKLLAHLPSDELTLSSTQFAVMLEEKLAIKSSILLTRIVFSRILRRHFDRKVAAAVEKSTFVSALEVFVTDKPLSTDSVEGQLRSLAARHSNLRTSFHALDADRSGSISTDEFVDFLEREAQMRFPHDVLQAFVKRFDIDGDGTLNYDEFAAFVYPKQFGINVLTPFGLFYQPVERDESMESIVGKIKTRMFWMQHNDLFSISTAASANSSAKITTTKLKVTDRFLITRHFGTLRVEYSPMDLVSTTFHSGELIVLILQDDIVAVVQEKERSKAVPVQDQPIPEFEYRLKLTTKRSIPPLLSMTLLQETTVEHKITSSPEEQGVQSGRPHSQSRRKHILQSTRQRTPSIASTKLSRAEDRMPKANKPQHATLTGVFANAQHVLSKQSASSKQVQPSNQPNAVNVYTINMSPVCSKPDEASPRPDDGAGTVSEHEYFDDAASSDENEDREDQEKTEFFGGLDVGDESECPPDTDATVEWDEPPPPYE